MSQISDDEEKLREELKDLIDDNPIEEDESEGEDSDGSGNSKKRKKSDDEEFDEGLEDDDYDLLEENLGHKIERKKKFKRLRRLDDDESGDDQEEHDEGEEREAIANQLFEGSDNVSLIIFPIPCGKVTDIDIHCIYMVGYFSLK